MAIFFWISAFLLFYTYIGYGLFLFLLNAFFSRKKVNDESLLPDVSFIVPAYNEARFIENKIKNTLALHYPVEKIRFVFITDGCTDDTASIISRYPQIKLIQQEKRTGKSAAINKAMGEVTTAIVVFSDANILLNSDSILKLVRHYANDKVGGVSGEKRVAGEINSAVGFGERLYWRYESLLKKANADFYTLVGASGDLFSIRTKLFIPLAENIILDDFVISAKVCQQGYRFLYESEAYSLETFSVSIKEERKRKVRISSGCYQALFLLTSLLNPFTNFPLSFQYISHRVLRWIVCPVLLPFVFVTGFIFYFKNYGEVYVYLFWGQLFFYMVAVIGFWLGRTAKAGLLLVPYYFAFMILSQYAGFYRFIGKRHTVFWEKADRNISRAVEEIK